MSWLRLYTDIVNDPKVQTLPPDLFKVWIGVLCIAKENGGTLPAIETVAFQLRFTSVSECFKAIESLTTAGLIDKVNGTTLAPHNWRKRQYVSDVSTPRVQQFRERQRNVSETPPETETETETETEKKEPRASALTVEQEFATGFWPLYPNKVGKPAALKAFVSARRKAGLDEILDGLQRYIASKPPDRNWLNPTTFLNQERWNDQPAHAAQSPPRLTRTQEAAQELFEEIENRGTANGNGHRRLGLCGPRGDDAGWKPDKPAARPEDVFDAADDPAYGGTQIDLKADG